MELDDIRITRAIIENYKKKLLENLETDVAIVGAGPSALVAAYYLAWAGKKVAIFGDPKQMQPRRFAFTQQQVATEAWHRHGMDRHDPEKWLDPRKQSLLDLAFVRAEEELLLDEHFRCLPPIVNFSNSHK